MMQMILMTCMLINSFMFTQLTHPLSLGLILLVQTILTCLLTGLISSTFWFSYILFLVFIGGMLILFIYMSSLSPNEKMMFNSNIFMKILMISMGSMIFLFIDKSFWLLSTSNSMNKQNLLMNLINENYLNLSKLYETPNNLITIMLMIYLLLTLVVVVKITNSFMGPLRQKNYE